MRLYWLIISSFFALFPSDVFSTPLSVADVVAKLQANYERITSYQANFSQQLRSSSFDRIVSEGKGNLYFKKPGKMCWHYNEPEEHFYITDGDIFWDYLPSEKQVLKIKLSEALITNIPRSFLFGMGKLDKEFEISFHSKKEKELEEVYHLDLVPKDKSAREVFGTLELWVDAKDFLVREAKLTDPLGNINKLTFSEIKLNPKLDDKIFSFQPPQGVEVITSTKESPNDKSSKPEKGSKAIGETDKEK